MGQRGILLIGIILIILLSGMLYFRAHNLGNSSVAQTATPTPSAYCSPQELDARSEFGAGAGNVYGDFTLINHSKRECQIMAGFITPENDSTVKNLTVTQTGTLHTKPFVLSPDQTLYSRVHYPNGPQCQSIGLNQTKVTFTYKLSPSSTVTFKDQEGKTEEIVQTCSSLTDMTEIQVWALSDQPITP